MDLPGRHMVLGGAGHAHMNAIASIPHYIANNVQVTVIGSDRYHYYSGMGPGVLGGTYTADEIRFCSAEQVERRGGQFVEDEIVHIDAKNSRLTLHSGRTLGYDVLSCNLGSQVRKITATDASLPQFSVKPIRNLQDAASFISVNGRSTSLKIVIIGGGASAAEIAGNITERIERERLAPPEITICCRTTFLHRSSLKIRNICRKLLEQRNIFIKENAEAVRIEKGKVLLANREVQNADLVFYAQGIVPSPVFRKSGLEIGEGGGLKVNEHLQALCAENILAGGDCCDFTHDPLDKVGVHAVRQGPIIAHNVLAILQGNKLREFHPNHKYLSILNLGKKYGLAEHGRRVIRGRLAFTLKDLIDKRFIRRFR